MELKKTTKRGINGNQQQKSHIIRDGEGTRL